MERERFEKGVHLLKKDIQQLMHARGVQIDKSGPTNMLADLKALLNHETSMAPIASPAAAAHTHCSLLKCEAGSGSGASA